MGSLQDFSEIVTLAEQAISIPSVSGDETRVLDFLTTEFRRWGWSVEHQPVDNDRYNIFCCFGTPRVLFTTHVDVVPAPPSMFVPKRENGRLFGRGSCDAKGVAAAMAGACRQLNHCGYTNFGLLLVVGEERDGIGARSAAEQLAGRGVEFLINGEPTQRKMVKAQKGMLQFRVDCSGRSGHSGYPDVGEDANAKLIRFANELLNLDLEADPILGKATVNVGVIGGGVACNVISSSAHLECVVRLVGSPESALQKIEKLIAGEGTISIVAAVPPAQMEVLDGYETDVVAFYTDIPNFSKLGAKTFLFGPGSIDVAHTDAEFIELSELEASVKDYQDIFHALS